ncbi:MAG: cytochrome c maturation protein CcmE [Bacteroidales bacterium]|nr:cytochrome c maturation protein CcmE [Bacteroidales bacterium]HNW74485.1 cytochrome c maturation protein CcmE [Bacteroidales bacterium]HPS51360.1 cytochrome c maturation protein CcmE [Bacteroidales bacterium]
MKAIHIIIIIFIVVVVAVVITTMTDSSTYSDFTQASLKPGKELHIIGTLNRLKPLEYDPKINANRFSFYLIDEKGIERKVVYNNAKPQDFEKSEKVVIIGSMKGDQFVARSLLLKCPSKYENDKPAKFGEQEFDGKPQ